ncbi:hypothetical protein KUTeg_007408 [Tegillarca granosa]|uniref:Tetratricopeptide repeat protein 38 n=1 Tax=Tegillarca granosa TaxID=220873 RepID=A0ABQ9FD71_TEGGR|nr:hypothetical protein KUTeg_007408 [Tegillarca granosa]
MKLHHDHWRDCQEWIDYGTPMSTTSNETCKLYDAALTQYVCYYDDPTLGGIMGCLDRLVKNEPNFVLAHVFKNGLDAIAVANSVRTDEEFAKSVNHMVTLGKTQNISDRERKHVMAVKQWTDGNLAQAAGIWDDIVCAYPRDMLAIKFCEMSNFYLGQKQQLRDNMAGIIPQWKSSMPLYGYLYGMYAFGLCETGAYDKAEKKAKMGLEMVEDDPWCSHALVHTYEMAGRFKDALNFIHETENNWNGFGALSGHIYWHEAVYNIEKGNYEEALGVFDNQLKERGEKLQSMLGMYDAFSLLYRLELEGADVKDRWSSILETHKEHFDEHVLAWNDVHLLIGCIGSKNKKAEEQLMDSIRDYIKTSSGYNRGVSKEVLVPLCEGLLAYESGEYDKAVDLVFPIRYKIVKRDIFDQFLIHAAIRSTSKENKQRARFLLEERTALKDNSPLTERLRQKMVSLHDD